MSHRAIYTADDSCTFVDRGEFTVEVSRKSLSAWNLSFGGGNLTHRFGKEVISVRMTECAYAVQKPDIPRQSGNLSSDAVVLRPDHLHGSGTWQHRSGQHLLFIQKYSGRISDIMLDSHSGKYNSKLFIGIIPQRGLLYDLCRKLVMRESVS